MNKRLKAHQKKQHFIKIYLADKNGSDMAYFEGVILDQNKIFVLMIDFQDFEYDGYVIFKKKDICEIKRTENEKMFQKILEEEKILKRTLDTCKPIELGDMKKMLSELKKRKLPLILERKYNSENVFQLGSIASVTKSGVKINYINARGEYDLKLVSSKFKKATFIKVDSPYSNLFFKYGKQVK